MDADTLETDLTAEDARERIERGSTGIRILLTILFAVIWSALEAVIGVIVVFSLAWALITRQAPPLRLRELSNWLVTYAYDIWRYLTYAEARVPFPFSTLSQPIQPLSELGSDSASEVRELLDRPDYDDEDDVH